MIKELLKQPEGKDIVWNRREFLAFRPGYLGFFQRDMAISPAGVIQDIHSKPGTQEFCLRILENFGNIRSAG
jgi:hypothetical protein